MIKSIKMLLLFSGILLLGNKCAPDHGEEHHHLLDKIRAHKAPVNYELNTNALLDSTLLLSVQTTLPEIANFFTEKRTPELTSFPCSSCHLKPLDKMQVGQSTGKKQAHWEIQISHAKENTMNCLTCHAKDNLDALTSLTGELIPMDESYKLCSQCHSTQFNDWQGGAHGKELTGWAPPRVAKNCVSCHNPHKPAFPSRFPARLNTNDLEDE